MTPDVFVECGADLNHVRFPFTRKHFMHPNDTIHFRQKYNNQGVYQTAMMYLNPTWITDAKGKVIIDAKESLKYADLYLDFDSDLSEGKGYQELKEDVYKAFRYLKIIMGVRPSDVRIYFSGNKGIHLTVPAHVLGIQPHNRLHVIFKELAMDISRYTTNDTLDTAIYDTKRLFRMVNSFHIKGQAFKIPITMEEFDTLTLDGVKFLARQQRFIETKEGVVSNKARAHINELIQQVNQRKEKKTKEVGKIAQIKELPPCIMEMHRRLFKESVDERNNSGTALASFYYQKGLTYDETLALLHNWSEQNCEPSLAEQDVITIVTSVYQGGYKYGCEAFHRLSGVCDKDNCPLFN